MTDPRLSTDALGDISALLGAGRSPAKLPSAPPDDSVGSQQSTQARRLSARDLRKAMKNALAYAGCSITEDMLTVKEMGGRQFQFSLRLDKGYRPLPQIPSNVSPPKGGLKGAWYLLLGMLQQLGADQEEGASRVTARIVSVETSEILKSGMGTITGMGAPAVEKAMIQAIEQLGPVFLDTPTLTPGP